MASIRLYDEPLQTSTPNYCFPFKPLIHRDPLFEYGAVSGKLPGRNLKATLMTQDIPIAMAIPDDGLDFSFIPLKLLEVGYLVLALSQVMKELVEFLYLRITALLQLTLVLRSSKHRELAIYLMISKNRCEKAHKKIRQFFNELKVMLLDSADTFSGLETTSLKLCLRELESSVKPFPKKKEFKTTTLHPMFIVTEFLVKPPSDEVKARRGAYYLSMKPPAMTAALINQTLGSHASSSAFVQSTLSLAYQEWASSL
ncbi:hypothetical protein CVT26_013345 [Gymnopilus dilepis]|uniref:Uncharacterized protein n=1 Tax=Gymnopilus dilepis TaxID=231916 RepID=A0A409X5S3_9AGAR|nr:hypothetical protein CVT26_013345 [Gymnopilus dilepis]